MAEITGMIVFQLFNIVILIAIVVLVIKGIFVLFKLDKALDLWIADHKNNHTPRKDFPEDPSNDIPEKNQ